MGATAGLFIICKAIIQYGSRITYYLSRAGFRKRCTHTAMSTVIRQNLHNY